MLRNFVRKNIGILSVKDIRTIREHLDSLSPWPWSPKFITEISKAADLEFAARSPEVVAKLCDWLLVLYEKLEAVTFAFNITTCSKCIYWEGDTDLSSEGIMYGKCTEPTNKDNFTGGTRGSIFLTPMNYGCVNGNTKEGE